MDHVFKNLDFYAAIKEFSEAIQTSFLQITLSSSIVNYFGNNFFERVVDKLKSKLAVSELLNFK